MRLVVVDTDTGFLQVLGRRLERAGWAHRTMGAPPRVDELVALRVNAMVVDPAVAGPEAAGWLRVVCSELPGLSVVVCTGPSTVAQRVHGLRLGADDWVTKPCHPEELLARVEAAVRRRRAASVRGQEPAVVAGEVEIRPELFQAFVGSVSVELTRREYDLLRLLSDAPGQVLEREEIYQRVWGYAMAHGDRSVDVFVRKLRRKLEARSPGWKYVHTHFGIGYRFEPEPREVEAPAPGAAARAGDATAAVEDAAAAGSAVTTG